MRIVIALGGNTLLERHDKPDATVQRHHVRRAAQANAGVAKPVVALVTQTVVDPGDPAFAAPTKFIGAGYSRPIDVVPRIMRPARCWAVTDRPPARWHQIGVRRRAEPLGDRG